MPELSYLIVLTYHGRGGGGVEGGYTGRPNNAGIVISHCLDLSWKGGGVEGGYTGRPNNAGIVMSHCLDLPWKGGGGLRGGILGDRTMPELSCLIVLTYHGRGGGGG